MLVVICFQYIMELGFVCDEFKLSMCVNDLGFLIYGM